MSSDLRAARSASWMVCGEFPRQMVTSRFITVTRPSAVSAHHDPIDERRGGIRRRVMITDFEVRGLSRSSVDAQQRAETGNQDEFTLRQRYRQEHRVRGDASRGVMSVTHAE